MSCRRRDLGCYCKSVLIEDVEANREMMATLYRQRQQQHVAGDVRLTVARFQVRQQCCQVCDAPNQPYPETECSLVPWFIGVAGDRKLGRGMVG